MSENPVENLQQVTNTSVHVKIRLWKRFSITQNPGCLALGFEKYFSFSKFRNQWSK